MSEYSNVRISKLKLKGAKSKQNKTKKRKHKETKKNDKPVEDTDAISHGGWWCVSKCSEIRGAVAIEIGNNCYIKALDNGLFILGAPHNQGTGPDPEEILTAVSAGDESRVALKSGYGKYLGVDGRGRMMGRADAIGVKEQWEPVFQDGKTALMGSNGCFVSVAGRTLNDTADDNDEDNDDSGAASSSKRRDDDDDDDDDHVVVRSSKAGPAEMLRIRSMAERQDWLPQIGEDDGNLNKIELNYVKQFQKFQDKRIRLHTGGAEDLKMAREEGKLHEKLLDRRSSMKADRYCK